MSKEVENQEQVQEQAQIVDNEKVVARGIVSAKILVDNSGDMERKFDIEGVASVSTGAGLEGIESGRVSLAGSGTDGTGEVASFNCWGANGLNMSMNDTAAVSAAEVAAAISEFMAEVRKKQF